MLIPAPSDREKNAMMCLRSPTRAPTCRSAGTNHKYIPNSWEYDDQNQL